MLFKCSGSIPIVQWNRPRTELSKGAGMNQIDLTPEEVEGLTNVVRQGAAAIVEAWEILTKIGERTKRDWDPEEGRAVRDILDIFASSLRTRKDITAGAVKEMFSRPEDWQ
jgi:hypothetical protein